MRPTEQNYTELQRAYDYFNTTLFDGVLPDCLITLQRKERTYGYVSYNRFTNTEGKKIHEMALNPAYFAVSDIQETMQTLVHEMCHIWQYHQGTPGRGRYHNKEWADYMESIGLMPSHTGLPGGNRTGDQMMDYAIEGGRFLKELNNLVNNDFRISWIDRFPEKSTSLPVALATNPNETIQAIRDQWATLDIVEPTENTNKSNRAKYSCPKCDINVWGKPNLHIKCGTCELQLES